MSFSYIYPDINMWDDATWQGREAPVQPLVNKLCKYMFEAVRPKASLGLHSGRTDGEYNAKSNVRVYPEVVAALEEMGLKFHVTSMGFMAWVALIPKEAKADTPVVLRYHSVDMSDENWAMDTMAYYAGHNAKAAESGFALVYLVTNAPFGSGIFTDILMEVSALWRLDLKPIYMDLSGLPEDSFPGGEDFYGLRVLNIDDQWQAYVGHQYICGGLNKRNPEFDLQKLIHSPLGKAMAEGMRMEYDFRRWDDPRLLAQLEEKGIRLEGHFMKGERYLTASPIGCDKKLPLFICMKEVRTSNEFHALTALQFYSGHLELVAMQECMILFFAMESPEDNELLVEIMDHVMDSYPIDRSRVYITGQSHNGYLALDFACRHIDRIAAIATLNDRHGIASPLYAHESVPVTDEMVEIFKANELPLINICGQIENVFPHTQPGTRERKQAIEAYRRRLVAFNCPEKSAEEVEAALQSSDIAQRKNGVCADRTEVRYSMGHEVYVADVQNKYGKWQLRFVSLDNLPHMITPNMAQLSWEFLRRFARGKDGRIIELDKTV
ncbi:MAG: hypothetical protein E7420_03855 [Ruminococcaceae bacterium]|nr:hypothetical protein [Oscillospiraceae bacterium]